MNESSGEQWASLSLQHILIIRASSIAAILMFRPHLPNSIWLIKPHYIKKLKYRYNGNKNYTICIHFRNMTTPISRITTPYNKRKCPNKFIMWRLGENIWMFFIVLLYAFQQREDGEDVSSPENNMLQSKTYEMENIARTCSSIKWYILFGMCISLRKY